MTALTDQRSRDLSYALYKVADYIKNKELNQRLKGLSFALLQYLSENNTAKLKRKVAAIAGLVDLGVMIGEVSESNGKVLSKELERINTAIKDDAGEKELPDLSTMLTRDKVSPTKSGRQSSDADELKKRQEAILAKIKESGGKAQLKDFIAVLPGVSERTIRYDVQRLTDEGKIERQGSGGPSNFYTLPGLTGQNTNDNNPSDNQELPPVINL